MPVKADKKAIIRVLPENLTVGKSILSPKQISVISKPTPPEFLYKRKGRGGNEFTYVKGHYIKQKLNEIFGHMWDFVIVDKGREGNQLWVHGRLVVHFNPTFSITKEQFGGAEIKFITEDKKDEKGNTVMNRWNKPVKVPTDQPVDLADDYKAATTDALKKCANEWGICNDVYAEGEYSQIEVVEGEAVRDDFTALEPADQVRLTGAQSKEELLKIANGLRSTLDDKYHKAIEVMYTQRKRELDEIAH